MQKNLVTSIDGPNTGNAHIDRRHVCFEIHDDQIFPVHIMQLLIQDFDSPAGRIDRLIA